MTFGEHLEELRSSLFRAVLALLVGFIVGLMIGHWVVQRIQDPLVNALKRYYEEASVERYQQMLAEMEAKGVTIPPELKNKETIKQFVVKEQLFPQEYYIATPDLIAALKKQYPEALKGLPDEPAVIVPDGKDKLTQFTLWHKVEDDERLKVKGLSAQEAFMIWMKAAFVTGAVLASPAIFYFLWSFVAAGLYPHEKRYVHVFLPFSLALFLAGAGLAFFFVFEPVLDFFFTFNKWLGIEPDPRISEWLGFVLMMPLAFGISFQLPLVMLFLERIGIFDIGVYLAKWRVAVLVIAVVSMVLSPGGDPYSMLLMLIPLVFLYFGGVGLCKWLPSNRNPYADATD